MLDVWHLSVACQPALRCPIEGDRKDHACHRIHGRNFLYDRAMHNAYMKPNRFLISNRPAPILVDEDNVSLQANMWEKTFSDSRERPIAMTKRLLRCPFCHCVMSELWRAAWAACHAWRCRAIRHPRPVVRGSATLLPQGVGMRTPRRARAITSDGCVKKFHLLCNVGRDFLENKFDDKQ